MHATVPPSVKADGGVGKGVHFIIDSGAGFSQSTVGFDGNRGLDTTEIGPALRSPQRRHQIHRVAKSGSAYLPELFQARGYSWPDPR